MRKSTYFPRFRPGYFAGTGRTGDVSHVYKEWVEQGKPEFHLRFETGPAWSLDGRPVPVECVNGKSRRLEDPEGMEKAMMLLNWSRNDLAKATGKSRRTIDSYLGNRPRWRVQEEVLWTLKNALEARK